ncbi:hypothetical protein CTI14_56540, partial [Methylobacterium radiotolerans]
KAAASLLIISLVSTVPFSAGYAEGHKWTNVNTYEEQDGSKFNSENYDFVKFSQIGTKLNIVNIHN